MRLANRISGAAHKEVMRKTRAGMHEYEVQAIFESACMKQGLKHLAYPSIVATGCNGAVLHYRRNNARLRAGQLLLIDSGAEKKGYAADITRTFPVSRRFTRRQRDIYSIVLATQKKIIAAARPGAHSADLHVESMRLIAEGLRDIRILKGSVDSLVATGAVRLFYPHGFGHLLGLDVHDGSGGRKRRTPGKTQIRLRFMAKLEPNFAITVEPGIYFIEALLNSKRLAAKHRSSIDFTRARKFLDFGGIRIEDDILVRRGKSPLNLTSVPKEIKEIEELRRSA